MISQNLCDCELVEPRKTGPDGQKKGTNASLTNMGATNCDEVVTLGDILVMSNRNQQISPESVISLTAPKLSHV